MISNDNLEQFDIALIGCGLHALTLLATAPQLLRFRVAIIEKEAKLGGAMRRYVVPTNSKASKFFSPFAASPYFSKLFETSPELSDLLVTHKPVRADLVGKGLELIGECLLERANPKVFLGREVTSICFAGSAIVDSDVRFALTLSGGSLARSRVCILATGREERLSPDLDQLQRKVLLSSRVLEGRYPMSELMPTGKPRKIAILGSSHSAFSALELMVDHIDNSEGLSGSVTVDILHRDDIALYYPSIHDARREQVPGQEKIFDVDRDVCPETGAIFRDSGLRGRAKEICRSIANGSLGYCRMVRIDDVRTASLDDLSCYDYVVQALWSSPKVPRFQIKNESVWSGQGNEIINIDFDGRVLIPVSRKYGICPPLFALRVVPTAVSDKDRNPDAHNVYARMAAVVEGILTTGQTL